MLSGMAFFYIFSCIVVVLSLLSNYSAIGTNEYCYGCLRFAAGYSAILYPIARYPRWRLSHILISAG